MSDTTLTMDQIRSAQSNEIGGTTAVLEAMQGRITGMATEAAKRMDRPCSHRYNDFKEEFRQDAALAMFEALPRFTGETVDAFFAFMWTTVEDVLKDKVRDSRNQGVDTDAAKIFGAMLEKADGDVHLAEKMAQTVPPKGRRLSADRAQAARMAYTGTRSIDAPSGHNKGESAGGSGSEGDDIYLLAAYLPSTLGIPEDLLTAADITSEEKRVKHAIVHAILDSMGPNQARALRHSYGIGDVRCYGTGDAGDLDGLARELGLTTLQARDARVKGHKAFAKRYIKAVARDAAHEAELTEAAASKLSHGGRK